MCTLMQVRVLHASGDADIVVFMHKKMTVAIPGPIMKVKGSGNSSSFGTLMCINYGKDTLN